MKKYIFKYYDTDGYTYGSDIIIPFECDDILKFILDVKEKIESSKNGDEILGIHIGKDEIDKIEESFFTLEDWFEKDKYK